MAGTITALEVQKGNQERVNVFLDDEFAFGLSMIDAARLHKGQTLSDAEIEALKGQDAVALAFDRAVRFLGYRPRSIEEIRRNLSEHQTDVLIIDDVIERLRERGYVDDLAFARFWVSNRQQFKPRGSRALRFELREKGIPLAIIDEALADLDTGEAAYQVAQDKARRLRGLDKRTFRNKLGAFLARRGFDFETIGQAINRLIEEIEEGDPNAFSALHNDIEE